MKNWIKENGMYVAIVVIVILVLLFIVNRARKAKGGSEIKPLKLPKLTRTVTPAPAQESKSLEQLKKELADCEDSAKSMRLIAGNVHPCANLRDMVAKASGSESNFNGTGAFAKTNGLNVLDFGMGLDGMSLLEDKNLKSQMESNFRGGAGLNSLNTVSTKPKMCHYPDGTPVPCSELSESNYRLINGGATKPRMCRYPTGEPCPCGSDEHCG